MKEHLKSRMFMVYGLGLLILVPGWGQGCSFRGAPNLRKGPGRDVSSTFFFLCSLSNMYTYTKVKWMYTVPTSTQRSTVLQPKAIS